MTSKSIMRIKRIDPKTKYLYHFTLKSNVGKILKDKTIKSSDDYVFFTGSLSDSVTAFNNEMMAAGKPYIDLDCNLRYREKCSKDDYCILKIPYINDERFFKFEFDNLPDDSIYQLSIAHKGGYDFKKARVLEIPDKKKRSGFTKLATAGLALGIALTPCTAYADSWLDDGSYDISWYDESKTSYTFYDNGTDNGTIEKRIAGASYLSNQGKLAKPIDIYIDSPDDIDLSSHSWSPMRNVKLRFTTRVCGIHRIILKYGEKVFDEGTDNCNYRVAHYMNIKAGTKVKSCAALDTVLAKDLYWEIYQHDNGWVPWITDNLGNEDGLFSHLILTHNGIEVFGDEAVSEQLTSEDDYVEYFDDRKIFSVTVEDPSRKNPTNLRRIVSDQSADIKTIREKISTVVNIPVSSLKLKLGDSTLLEDGKTLASYNIGNNTQIFYERAENNNAIESPQQSAVKQQVATARMKAGKKSMTISWNKIRGADGYDIFFAPCNKNDKMNTCKNIKSISGNNTFKWTKSGLKKGTPYKAYVKAYSLNGGKKTYVSTSSVMHSYTGNGTRKYTNAKSVTVKKSKVSLKKGKTYKIKAKVKKVRKSKKLMPKSHAPRLRYLTSDSKVATVSRNGKITAKGKGRCSIIVFAHNGVSKSIKVTVK